MSPASEQVEKISKFFRFLRDEKTLSFLRLAPMQQIETHKTRGADSAIGDLRREFSRFPRLDAPLARFALACTSWVASHYM